MQPSDPLANALPEPFWAGTTDPAPACPPLAADAHCDLAVIGGGFTGLWTALKARERDPEARIVLLEAKRCGQEASGRNGGFCAPSISHGVGNAVARWPAEAETLIRLGRENLDGLARDLDALGIDAEFERSGKLNVAATSWQADGLRAMQHNYRRFGIDCQLLEGDALRDRFDSPKYMCGLFEPNYGLVNPARLVAGLRRQCLSRGIEIHEGTPVTALAATRSGLRLATPQANLQAARAVMATNAAVPLLRRLRPTVIPIFDYALVTAPLTDAQLAAIGWTGRHGIADSGNQFHYSRKTADNRILWGGYDAVYHFGSRRDDALYQRRESFARLAGNFADAFPALAGIPFTHAWGGIIDTSARTTFFSGLALNGRLAYALGFTGQGVSASRFAALAMLDMLGGQRSARTEIAMMRRRPVPFPPEPLRYLAVRLAQRGLAREDQTGRRSLFLKTLDRFRIGFDS